jgi:Mannosyltransferase (PIG-V)
MAQSPAQRYPEPMGETSWRFVLKVFVASRLFYLLAGGVLAGLVPVGSFQRETSDVPFGTLNLWAHFDGENYMSVAAYGYQELYYSTSPAFFPLYPMLMRALAELFGGPVSYGTLSVWGILISLVTLFFALWFVYRITEEGWGEQAAKGAVLTLAFFPTAFFLNAVYTESLFLMLSAGAVWAIRVRKDLLLACLLAGLATATRNVGILLLIPLAYEWWRERHAFGWRVVYFALVPSGLLAYAAWLWWRFGDPLLFLSEQARWKRELSGPLSTLQSAFGLAAESLGSLFDPAAYELYGFEGLFYVFSGTNALYSLLFLLFAYAVLSLGVRWLPADLAIYSFALVLAPVFFASSSNPLMSMPRFVLVAFPIFITLGILLKSRRLLVGWIAASAVLSVALCALFVNWHFVA